MAGTAQEQEAYIHSHTSGPRAIRIYMHQRGQESPLIFEPACAAALCKHRAYARHILSIRGRFISYS